MPGPLSFMIGLRPTGLSEFIETAHPAGIYGLNNSPRFPGVLSVLRIQNDTWGRLPEACDTERYFEVEDPIASADYELLTKTQFVPDHGHLNLIDSWKLAGADWYAPYNEWALDQGSDAFLKADWMTAWTVRALEIAHAAGLRLCIGSFATGNPELYLLPNLYPMLRLAKLYGGILDLHEYGVEGALMSSPSSGALRYRTVYQSLPVDARVPIVLSEFWWGNGFEGKNITAQIADAAAYGRELVKDGYLLWASAFQLDLNAESNFTLDAVLAYADVAADIQKEGGQTVPFVFGIHSTAAPGSMTDGDVGGIVAAEKFDGYKFLTGDPPEHYTQVIALGILPQNCLTRLFVSFVDRPKPTPAQFCDEQRLAVQEAMAAGVTWFEVHNEPNLTSEWPYSPDPHDFISWLLQVYAQLRVNHPGIKLVSPGLSPQPNTPQWWQDFADHGVFEQSDAIGAHVYWRTRATMLTQQDGLNFIPLEQYAGAAKPIFITEYSNNQAADEDFDKGAQYVEWAAYLQQHHPLVTRAYCYIISSGTPADNTSRQTIVRDGVISQIAHGIADTIPTVPGERELDHWVDLDTGADLGNANPLVFTITSNRSIRAITRPVVARPLICQTSTDGFGTVTGGGTFAAGAQVTLQWLP